MAKSRLRVKPMEPNVSELATRFEGTSVLSLLDSPETFTLFETTAGPFEAGRYPSNWSDWVSAFSKETGLQIDASHIYSITEPDYPIPPNNLATINASLRANAEPDNQTTSVYLWFNLEYQRLEVIEVHAISPDAIAAATGLYESRYLVPIRPADNAFPNYLGIVEQDNYSDVFRGRIVEGITAHQKPYGFMYFRIKNMGDISFEVWDSLNWKSVPYRYL